MTMPKIKGYRVTNCRPYYANITVTADEFIQFVNRANNGTPPGTGFGVYDDVSCPECHKVWVAVALTGSKGLECPECGYYNPDFMWLETRDIPGEGSFLSPVGNNYRIITPN
jgi:rubredoxin